VACPRVRVPTDAPRWVCGTQKHHVSKGARVRKTGNPRGRRMAPVTRLLTQQTGAQVHYVKYIESRLACRRTNVLCVTQRRDHNAYKAGC